MKNLDLSNKKVWLESFQQFDFKESKDPVSGIKGFKIKGIMMPRAKVSRNGVLYEWNSVVKHAEQLKGRPLMYNHITDTEVYPKGHFTNSWTDANNWYYEADVDPKETEFIHKLNRGDLKHVSIQLIGGSMEQKYNAEGQVYTEAVVGDIIEGSVVPTPGFLDTSIEVLAESFKIKENAPTPGMGAEIPDSDQVKKQDETKEDITTTTGKGAIATQPLEGEKEDVDQFSNFPMEQFHYALSQELAKNTGEDPIAVAKRVLDVMQKDPDHYSKQAIESMDEKEIEEMLKEFKHQIGEPVVIPGGVEDVSEYQGQIGYITDESEEKYSIELSDGKKVKIDKSVFDICVTS